MTQADTPSRNTKSRAWCLTLNNYTTEEYEDIKKEFPNDTLTQLVLGEEIGENGTPHLQGCIRYKNARSFSSMKKLFPRANISECRNWDASINYCKKDKKYFERNTDKNIKKITANEQYENYMKQEYSDIKWYPWQEEIIKIIEDKASKRKIYWYYDYEGNIGKSFLARFLDWKYNAIIANGKQADVFNQYASFLEEYDRQPTLAIIDVPRSNKEYLCYSTLEKLKDGVFNSGKYEGKKLRLIPHHLIVFANFEPCKNKMSEDRWVIKEIEKD